MDSSRYGPSWFDSDSSVLKSQTYSVGTSQELIEAIEKANDGDIILLSSSRYELTKPLKINKTLSIVSSDTSDLSKLVYSGAESTPAFEMYPKGSLSINSIELQGAGHNYAFASLKNNMSSLYNLTVYKCKISNFKSVLKGYKYSFAEHLRFNSTLIKDCQNGIELSSEDDNKGEYNAENLTLINCNFRRVGKNVIDYYRGGYDESTVGGNLWIRDCSFMECGGADADGILIKTHGIIKVDISDNKFVNNDVTLVARLWGAKNNAASNNVFKNTGRIITEENLSQKLMY